MWKYVKYTVQANKGIVSQENAECQTNAWQSFLKEYIFNVIYSILQTYLAKIDLKQYKKAKKAKSKLLKATSTMFYTGYINGGGELSSTKP